VTYEVSSEEADLFPRIDKADSEETNVENVPNRFAVIDHEEFNPRARIGFFVGLNVLLQSPLP